MRSSVLLLSMALAVAAAANDRSPRLRLEKARQLAAAGSVDQAIEHLRAVVSFGVRFDPAEEAWKGIREDERFRQLEAQMRERTRPIVRSTVAFRLEKKLIPENLVYDAKSGAFYVGSAYQAKIIRVDRDGRVSDFVKPRTGGLLSVLGMKIDPLRRELWAAAGNFVDSPPLEVRDPSTEGKGALFRFDLETGKLMGVYRGKGEPQFNDLVVTRGGDVYTTAGGHGIWRVRAGAESAEPFFSRQGSFFNGLTMSPDEKTLFGASFGEGVMKIDIATKAHSLLELPPGVILGGIDGLYLHGDSVVAIQNGTNPMRVIRAWLDPERTRVTRFAVLEQEHPESDFPLTGVIVGNNFYYVARSQLRAFDGGKIWADEKLKDTIILKLPLD